MNCVKIWIGLSGEISMQREQKCEYPGLEKTGVLIIASRPVHLEQVKQMGRVERVVSGEVARAR